MRDVNARDYMTADAPPRRVRSSFGRVQPPGIAGIFCAEGDLFVTMDTPYERELMFEQVDLCAKRHGRVRLALDSQEYTVGLGESHGQACVSCHRTLDNHPAYRRSERVLCGRCARRDLL